MRVCRPILNHPMDVRTWSSIQKPSFIYNCISPYKCEHQVQSKQQLIIQTFGLSLIIYFLEDSPNLNKKKYLQFIHIYFRLGLVWISCLAEYTTGYGLLKSSGRISGQVGIQTYPTLSERIYIPILFQIEHLQYGYALDSVFFLYKKLDNLTKILLFALVGT